MENQDQSAHLRRELGFRDVFFFYVITVFNLRWLATAAAAGPSAITIWVIACLALFVPLVFCVLELSSRYPEEGGLYVWSKRAFGNYAGFMTGWNYWASNLPYFPGLLYFVAANILFVGGDSLQHLSTSPVYFISVALIGLMLAVVLNVIGLDVTKYLYAAGAVCLWTATGIVMVLGGLAWWKFGSANEISFKTLIPSTNLKDVVFWSTIAFAFGGVESASTMGDEIRDARRTIPRAIIAAAVVITGLYILGTLSVLLALPQSEVSSLQGILQAVSKVEHRIGVSGLSELVALLVAISVLGGIGAWFAATARLAFVAGLDKFLPPAFGKVHPKWGTPYVALLVQAGVAAVFAFLGQAGTTVRGAYEVLVSMGIIANFIPFLFMFAALIKVQSFPAGPDVLRVPGGKPVAILAGALGFFTTALSIVLATIPSESEPNPTLAVVKIIGLTFVLLLVGSGIFVAGNRQKESS